MGVWRQIAEYLYIKKRDPKSATKPVDALYAWDESAFNPHFFNCNCYYDN